MTRPEREAVTAVIERLPATIDNWSGGLATLAPLDVVEVRRLLGSLSSSGGGRWWAGPRDCREELIELASDRRYDSVIVLWPSARTCRCAAGAARSGRRRRRSGPASPRSPPITGRPLATDPDPEQGYVHEWLHQVEAIYRELGLGEAELPGLHDAADFTSTRPTTEAPFGASYADYHDGSPGRPGARTWAPWYRDWMTGRLRRITGPAEGPAPIGLTPERWALRRTTGGE